MIMRMNVASLAGVGDVTSQLKDFLSRIGDVMNSLRAASDRATNNRRTAERVRLKANAIGVMVPDRPLIISQATMLERTASDVSQRLLEQSKKAKEWWERVRSALSGGTVLSGGLGNILVLLAGIAAFFLAAAAVLKFAENQGRNIEIESTKLEALIDQRLTPEELRDFNNKGGGGFKISGAVGIAIAALAAVLLLRGK